ncbi:MAG: hypothetical protein ABSC48_14295 [Terracidiphilus sp.]
MKAAELVQNEPFADLLAATLSDFLTLRFGGEWRVSWTDTASGMRSQPWLVNLNINAIFRRGISRSALENIKREFAVSVIPWKRPFQRLYFWLATSAAPALLAHAIVNVEPSIPNSTECLIIPGTHKLRFLDAAAGVVYCHLKKGSGHAHFQAELEAREFAVSKGVPVPHILRKLSDDCIAEEMVIGTPLDRLTSSKHRAIGLRRALNAMEPLYRSTARQIGVAEYASCLCSRIAAIASTRETIVSTGALAVAGRLAGGCGLADQKVEIVRSHGDFQPGNILYNEGEVWLIDWEYSTERQRQYDLLTYNLRTRFANGLGRRIAAYAGGLADVSQLRLLQLFLLESILFELEALMVAPSQYAPKSLNAKLAEIEIALPPVLRSCTG